MGLSEYGYGIFMGIFVVSNSMALEKTPGQTEPLHACIHIRLESTINWQEIGHITSPPVHSYIYYHHCFHTDCGNPGSLLPL